MTKEHINVLFIGDIIGKPGLSIISQKLISLKTEYEIDFCIANGENGAAGKGLTEEIAKKYFHYGIDLITSGNHIFENYRIHNFLKNSRKLLRPVNYPFGVMGKGSTVITLANNTKVGVISLQGRTFMFNIDCPFRSVLEEINKLKLVTPIIIIDFHAEATAEKMAMGWYLNGKVSAVIGTHTHVQTSDERILDEGTAYITDVGMTGPFNSVIGMKKEVAIKRFLQQIPVRYQPAEEDLKFSGLFLSIDSETGKTKKIKRLFFSIKD